jgi:hypothetical protein
LTTHLNKELICSWDPIYIGMTGVGFRLAMSFAGLIALLSIAVPIRPAILDLVGSV